MASVRASVRCGVCKADFADASKATLHAASHPARKRPAEKGSIWQVHYNRKGQIVEVTGGPRPPKVGVQIERGEVGKPALSGVETADREIGHQKGADYSTIPCLCGCHYGQPDCNQADCQQGVKPSMLGIAFPSEPVPSWGPMGLVATSEREALASLNQRANALLR